MTFRYVCMPCAWHMSLYMCFIVLLSGGVCVHTSSCIISVQHDKSYCSYTPNAENHVVFQALQSSTVCCTISP